MRTRKRPIRPGAIHAASALLLSVRTTNDKDTAADTQLSPQHQQAVALTHTHTHTRTLQID